ncbi:TcpQ domain-containing protein [Citrobacter arsenatis]|uniref:TcpQ domain-containing protein n=1 Tax=Citrobacter arsenatis TaxID=2546350 RepID=UPI00300DDA04
MNLLIKITCLDLALISFFTITNVHASREMEVVQLNAVTSNKHSTGNEYSSKSPFRVDREKNPINRGREENKISEKLSLLLRKDSLLSKELELWASKSDYKLLWNSNRDYIIYNTIILNATSFDNVLNELGKLFDSENYGLVIKQYEVNKVIIIDAQ